MSCENCYKGFVLPGEPKGTMVGPDYFTAAPSDATQLSKAIVLLTDIFGLPLPNPRIVADHLAEHIGVDVWIPDYFNGAFRIFSVATTGEHRSAPLSGKPPVDVKDLEPIFPDRAGVKMSWLSTLRLIPKILPAIPRIISNRPSVVDARVQEACVSFTERISRSSTSVGYTVHRED
jgi:carboxymethylenebutenolidase